MTIVPVKSAGLDAEEVSRFAPTCSNDYRHLGVPQSDLRSSWENTGKIVQTADKLGFRNCLCPSSCQLGKDSWTFAAGLAPVTENINPHLKTCSMLEVCGRVPGDAPVTPRVVEVRR